MEEKLSLPSDGEGACAVLNPNAFTTPGTEPPPLSHPAQRIPVLHSPRQQWVVLPKAPQHLGHEASLRVPKGWQRGGNRACYCPGSVGRERKTAELYDSPIHHRRRRGAKSVL